MTTFKALIVDDEEVHFPLLQKKLTKAFPHIELIGWSSSVDAALLDIPKWKPDLVFLDVEMPPKTGFDLLKELEKVDFAVIFTTSYSKYAIDAFRVSAIDYLLKPYPEADFEAAVNKFLDKSASKSSQIKIDNLLKNFQLTDFSLQKIALPTSTGLLFVKFNEIIRCEASNFYTIFFLTDKDQVVVSRTMKDCEETLMSYGFFRIHQSHLINLRYIRKYHKGDGGQVEMEDGALVEVSRRKKDEFLKSLLKI